MRLGLCEYKELTLWGVNVGVWIICIWVVVMSEYSFEEVLEKIEDVWGGHNDFEEGGLRYVAFVIHRDVEDMKLDEWDEEECVEELADVAINSIRMMEEMGRDPSEEIVKRLENHQEKNPADVIESCTREYEAQDEF